MLWGCWSIGSPIRIIFVRPCVSVLNMFPFVYDENDESPFVTEVCVRPGMDHDVCRCYYDIVSSETLKSNIDTSLQKQAHTAHAHTYTSN